MPPEPSSPSGLPSRCGRVCEQDVHSGAITKIQGTFGAAMSVFYISRQQQGDSKAVPPKTPHINFGPKWIRSCACANRLGRNKSFLGNAQDLKRTQTDAKAPHATPVSFQDSPKAPSDPTMRQVRVGTTPALVSDTASFVQPRTFVSDTARSFHIGRCHWRRLTLNARGGLAAASTTNQTAGFASRPGFMKTVFFMGGIFYFLN